MGPSGRRGTHLLPQTVLTVQKQTWGCVILFTSREILMRLFIDNVKAFACLSGHVAQQIPASQNGEMGSSE